MPDDDFYFWKTKSNQKDNGKKKVNGQSIKDNNFSKNYGEKDIKAIKQKKKKALINYSSKFLNHPYV